MTDDRDTRRDDATDTSSTTATIARDLRTGTPVWSQRPAPRLSAPPLSVDTACDVAIVGAGISGALVAEALSEQGLGVVMIDRRKPLRGSTAASTALLQYEIDTPLTKLAAEIGQSRAQRIWRRSHLALNALRERARRLGIEADLHNRDSLYLSGNVLNPDALESEHQARRVCGFETQFLSRAEVAARYGIDGRAGLLGFDNLAADPVRLAAGFLRVAMKRGIRVFGDTQAADVRAASGRVEVTTGDGRVITARKLVFATGYEMPKGVPRKGHRIASTFAFATHPQPRAIWPTGCFIWEASDPYLYLRPGPDGAVICGGEDEDFADEAARDALLPTKIARLRAKIARLLPGLDTTPAYTWCGSFGASDTGTPSIGAVPRMPNCYAVLGYGGNGITFSMMAAQMLTTMILGGRDPDADLFSFRREF